MKKETIILIIILVTAFLLRLAPITFGLPYISVYGDEITHVIIAFKILANKSFAISSFGNTFLPPLLSYMLVPIYAIIGFFGITFDFFKNMADYKDFVIFNRELFLIPARVISAFFGVGAVYFLYLLTEKIFNKKIALISALFLAVSFLHTHDSQIGHIWSPITFFMIAGTYCCYMLYLHGGRKWYIFGSLCAGLGYAIGQVPLVVAFLVFTAHIFYIKRMKTKFWDQKIIIAMSLFLFLAGLFTFLNTYTFYKHGVEAIGVVMKLFGFDFHPATVISAVVKKATVAGNWKAAYQTLFFAEPPILIFGVLGSMLFLFKNKNFKTVAVLIFPLSYFAIMIFMYSLTYRYVIPLIPFLCLFAAYFIFTAKERISPVWAKNIFFIVAIVVVGGYSFAVVSLYTLKLLRPYTLSQSVDWVYKNVPSGKRIVSDIYLNRNKEAVKFLAQNNKFQWVDIKNQRLLTLEEEKYPKPNYFVIEPDLTDVFLLPLFERKADYFLVSFYNDKKEKEKYQMLEAFPGKKKLVAKFYPTENKKEDTKDLLNFDPHWVLKSVLKNKYVGPHVEIYETVK